VRSHVRHGRTKHIESAKHTRFVARLIDTEHAQCRGWVAVAFFYVVVHLVEAWMASQGIDNYDHTQRLRRIRELLGGEWEIEYDRIFGRSKAYRYECEHPTEGELADLLQGSVTRFMEHLCRKLMVSTEAADALLAELAP